MSIETAGADATTRQQRATDASHPPFDPNDRGGASDTGPHGRWRLAIVVVVAVTVGALLGIAVPRVFDGGSSSDAAAVQPSTIDDRTVDAAPEDLSAAGFVSLPDPPAAIPEAPASGPRAAVEGFLTAEANAAFEASFGFLSSEDQQRFGGPATWIAAHADVMPPVTAFEIIDVTDGPDGIQVTSVVGFRPSLDEIVGLVPAQAEISWAVTETDGTFGVSLDGSTFDPILLADDGAVDAAAAWVATRQSCAPAGEWGGTLLGVQGPVLELCGSTGPIEVAAATTLGQLDATAFVTAFGEDATTWARVVPVRAPVEFRVVLAPIGPEWRVIGALPANAVDPGN